MFRKEIKERVYKSLNDHPLTEHAFSVQFGDRHQLLRINYIFRQPFFFSVSAGQKDNYIIKRAPSEFLITEGTSFVDDVDGMFGQLIYWLDALTQEENIDAQAESELAKLKQEFFRNLGNHIKDENRHFTKEEAAELIKRIDQLEYELETIAKAQKKSDAAIANFKRTMNEAKQDVGTLTKNKWLRVGGGKILNGLLWFGKSKEGQKLIGEWSERLLGPGGGPHSG